MAWKLSEETKRRMSEAKKGKKLSDEHREKISNALSGRKLSDEHREKISNAVTRQHKSRTISSYTRDRWFRSIAKQRRQRVKKLLDTLDYMLLCWKAHDTHVKYGTDYKTYKFWPTQIGFDTVARAYYNILTMDDDPFATDMRHIDLDAEWDALKAEQTRYKDDHVPRYPYSLQFSELNAQNGVDEELEDFLLANPDHILLIDEFFKPPKRPLSRRVFDEFEVLIEKLKIKDAKRQAASHAELRELHNEIADRVHNKMRENGLQVPGDD